MFHGGFHLHYDMLDMEMGRVGRANHYLRNFHRHSIHLIRFRYVEGLGVVPSVSIYN